MIGQTLQEALTALGLVEGATIASLQRRLHVDAPTAMRLQSLRYAILAAPEPPSSDVATAAFPPSVPNGGDSGRSTESARAIADARFVAEALKDLTDNGIVEPDEETDAAVARILASSKPRAAETGWQPTEERPTRTAEWGLANVYMLARRRLRRLPAGHAEREWWEHVVRIAEEAGVRQPSVLRESVPTEITDGGGPARPRQEGTE